MFFFLLIERITNLKFPNKPKSGLRHCVAPYNFHSEARKEVNLKFIRNLLNQISRPSYPINPVRIYQSHASHTLCFAPECCTLAERCSNCQSLCQRSRGIEREDIAAIEHARLTFQSRARNHGSHQSAELDVKCSTGRLDTNRIEIYEYMPNRCRQQIAKLIKRHLGEPAIFQNCLPTRILHEERRYAALDPNAGGHSNSWLVRGIHKSMEQFIFFVFIHFPALSNLQSAQQTQNQSI